MSQAPDHAAGTAGRNPAQPAVPVRFAVVGCGMLARSQHIPNIVRSSRATLQVCCDLSTEALEACQRQFHPVKVSGDFRAVIRDPEVDAICLAATEKLRMPVIAAAAEAGKPIYVEKPLARTLEEVYQIQKVVRAAGIPFCVGHNRRCSPAMIEAHRIFRQHMRAPKPCPWRFDREGEGRPRLAGDGAAGMSVRINDDWWSWKKWVFDKEQAPHGPMLFEMTHFTDLCNWFLDAQPAEVVALEQGVFNSSVIIKYATGEMATIVMNANGTFGYPKELYELMGHGAVMAIDHMVEVRTAGIADSPAKITYPLLNDRHPEIGAEGGISGWLAKRRAGCDEAARTGDPSWLLTAGPDKGHAHAIERFIDEIIDQGPPVCGVDDAVMATRVAFAAIKSAQERRIVRMDEV